MRFSVVSLFQFAAALGLAGAACTDTCGTNNGASSYLGACKNGSQCTLTADSCIYCTGCPAGYSGNRCEIAPAGTAAPTKIAGQVCGTNNGADSTGGACQNGSTCTLTSDGYVYCTGCPAGYSGFRCEVKPAGPTAAPTKIAGQVCGTNNGADSAGGACQNGSTCTLTPEGYVYCTGCPAGYSGFRCEVKPAGPTAAPTKIAGQVCGTNNGADSAGGACQNGSTCTLTTEGYVYCTGCPAGYTGFRCQTPPAGTTAAPTTGPTTQTGICANNGANDSLGACKNGSTCTVGAGNLIYCANCPNGYSGYRCEIAPTGTAPPTNKCANNGAFDPLGPCLNGSTCTLNQAGQIYCANCPAGYSGFRCETKN